MRMHTRLSSSPRTAGFALVTVLSLLGVLALLLAAVFLSSTVEVSTTESSVNASTGFFSAEAGLNLRGDEIAQTFEGYNVPAGVGPSPADPCSVGNVGSGDFACRTDDLNGRDVVTYMLEDPANATGGQIITIPGGDPFAGLNAFENRYTVVSEAVNPRTDRPEAILEMVFRSRLVPMFQYAAFHDKDLEILPGPPMVLNGRIHTNGDLYLNAGNSLEINGEITVSERADDTGGDLFRRRKNNSDCRGIVRVDDAAAATNPEPTIDCAGAIPQSTLDAWNGRIRTGLETIETPEPEEFDPGANYWQLADLRLVLDLDAGRIFAAQPTAVGVVEDGAATAALASCSASTFPRPYPDPATNPGGLQLGPLESSDSFTNNREGTAIEMLEIDVQALLDCMHARRVDFFGPSGDIDDTSEGGLVIHATVVGPASAGQNNYGVRLRNGERLASTLPGAPEIRGLTVVTDQAAYVQGNYNVDTAGRWRPASVLADSLNILSEAWNSFDGDGDGVTDADAETAGAPGDGAIPAQATEINAAFLSGTDSTGGQEGAGGQGGEYAGGLENQPRFHEDWSGVGLRYRGSWVSLGNPRHVDGAWGDQTYRPPARDWDYDQRFNDPSQLPPLSPRFVYLVQELFVRDFEQ